MLPIVCTGGRRPTACSSRRPRGQGRRAQRVRVDLEAPQTLLGKVNHVDQAFRRVRRPGARGQYVQRRHELLHVAPDGDQLRIRERKALHAAQRLELV